MLHGRSTSVSKRQNPLAGTESQLDPSRKRRGAACPGSQLRVSGLSQRCLEEYKPVTMCGWCITQRRATLLTGLHRSRKEAGQVTSRRTELPLWPLSVHPRIHTPVHPSVYSEWRYIIRKRDVNRCTSCWLQREVVRTSDGGKLTSFLNTSYEKMDPLIQKGHPL